MVVLIRVFQEDELLIPLLSFQLPASLKKNAHIDISDIYLMLVSCSLLISNCGCLCRNVTVLCVRAFFITFWHIIYFSVPLSAFSRCHSYLCRRTLAFSSSVRSVGNRRLEFHCRVKHNFLLCCHGFVLSAFVRYTSSPVR